jgi:predicted dithiol-disulfide oxidoreductase (DUF899 family)
MTEAGLRFPGESDDYRVARRNLMNAEIALRRASEAVAIARRALPPGGRPPEDYAFEEAAPDGGARPVRLSELFEPGTRTLLVYGFMYGPEADKACPSCTSILDALDGTVRHLTQRVSFAVVARAPLPRILAHARERGWRHLRLLSSAQNTFNRDYHAETPDGHQVPILHVFVRDGDDVRHFWSTEFLPPDEGQEGRELDFLWPLWTLLDATPEGRGADTDFPRLDY